MDTYVWIMMSCFVMFAVVCWGGMILLTLWHYGAWPFNRKGRR